MKGGEVFCASVTRDYRGLPELACRGQGSVFSSVWTVWPHISILLGPICPSPTPERARERDQKSCFPLHLSVFSARRLADCTRKAPRMHASAVAEAHALMAAYEEQQKKNAAGVVLQVCLPHWFVTVRPSSHIYIRSLALLHSVNTSSKQ